MTRNPPRVLLLQKENLTMRNADLCRVVGARRHLSFSSRINASTRIIIFRLHQQRSGRFVLGGLHNLFGVASFNECKEVVRQGRSQRDQSVYHILLGDALLVDGCSTPK